ncbi:MAG: UvrD-helicase domain-containing protein [Patescibacteria group bacterium]|nr:UvrD-helicase domain-containing protein [Patescibacteria group bacterium]
MFTNLNPEQINAVKHINGPLLIIAGAGSGKTRTLTHRISYLIKECGVDPWHILAVTFTNKAAGEMKERVEALLSRKTAKYRFIPDLSEAPLICTFHSFGVRLLREEGQAIGIAKKFVIYDASDARSAIKKAAIEADVDIERYNPKFLQWAISGAKNDNLEPLEFAGKIRGDLPLEQAAKTYMVYQKKLMAAGALDFDDLLLQSVRLFKKHPEILMKYQERFQYLLVDEYQDTNKVQYELISMLASKYRNLCVVGDDDQSIYAWRGADIRNILEFEKDFNDARVIKLEQNYRSTSHILNAAHAVISKNTNRKDKKLWTERGLGNQVTIVEAYSGRDEAFKIVHEIESIVRNGMPNSVLSSSNLSDIAVLYRTNAQSRVLEEAFLDAGIPYKIVGGTRFYERKEIKDILAYLKVLANPLDDVSLSRIINVPPRKVGAVTLDKLNAFSIFNEVPLHDVLARLDEVDLSPLAGNALANFYNLLKELRQSLENITLSGFLRLVIDKVGYDRFLLDGSEEGEERYENIMELLSVSKRYDEMQADTALQAFLEEVALVTDLDTLADNGSAVALMTIHSAKGLEFPVVFISGMEEDLFPHTMAKDNSQDIEEERRLCYVGMTRAMDKLFLCYAKERLIFGQSMVQRPSRFLDEIPEEYLNGDLSGGTAGTGTPCGAPVLNDNWCDDIQYTASEDLVLPDFEIGEIVMHDVFGNGVIREIIGRVATVDFGPKNGVKKMLAEKLRRVS